MADTSVPITAGTGTSIDTRTEATNGNHRQVVVLGDPSTNAGVAPVDATSGLKVTLGSDNGVTVSSQVPGTGSTNLGKAEDAASSSGDTGVMILSVRRDGAISSSPTSTAGDYQEITTDTYGQVRTAFQAKTANPSAASDGNGIIPITDKLGKQVVVGSIRDLKVNQITTITASTSETTVLTAVASTFLDVYGVIAVNSSASATNVAFKDATAGTTRFNIYVPAGETRGFMLSESGSVPQATVNNNWTATSSASVSSLVITMLAVKNI